MPKFKTPKHGGIPLSISASINPCLYSSILIYKSVHYTSYVYNLYTKFIQNVYTNNCMQNGSLISKYFDQYFLCTSYLVNHWTLPEKQTNRRGGQVEEIHFWCPLEFFIFFTLTLPLEIPDKTKHSTPGYYKIMLDPLEIPRPKTETPRNSTLFFLGHLWKFHFVFI